VLKLWTEWWELFFSDTLFIIYAVWCVYCLLKDDGQAGVLLHQLEEKKREIDEG